MVWPTTSIPTSNLDAGTDSPAAARAELLTLVQQFEQLKNHVSAFARTFLDDATADAVLTTLGGTSVGKALFIAANAGAARSAIESDVYKTLPIPATPSTLTTGEMAVVSSGFTLSTGLPVGHIYPVYNESGSTITITQGPGLTLRLAGTTLTGNRSLSPRGVASIWVRSATEYIISGAGAA